MGKQKAAAVQRAARQRAAAQRSAARRRQARRDPERLARLLTFGAIGALMLVIAGIIGFGWYETHVAPMNKTVIKAGDASISFGAYERRVLYLLNQLANQANLGTVPDQVKAQLEAEVTLLAAAPSRDINPSESDLDAYIRQQIGGGGSDAAYVAAYRNAVHNSGLHLSEYRQMMKAQMVQQQLQDGFQKEVPATAEQVHLRVIHVANDQDAQKAQDRLKAGEDFAVVAGDMTTDTAAKAKGGDTDWSVKEQLPPAYADQAFTLQVGQVSATLKADDGTEYIIQVVEKDPARQVTDTQKGTIATSQYQVWLTQERDQQNLQDTLSQDDMVKAFTWALGNRRAQPTAAPAQVPTEVPGAGTPPADQTPSADQTPAEQQTASSASDQTPAAQAPSDQTPAPQQQPGPAQQGQ